MDWLCSWPAFAIGVGLYLIVLIFKLVRDPDNAYVTHFIAIPFAIGALGVKFFDGFMADFLMFILLYLAGALGVFLLYLLIGRIIQKELVQNIVLAVISVALCAVVVIAEVEIDWGNHDIEYYRPPTQSNSGSKKEKCAWCGKYAELTGKFCDDCNENAFGKDGWYN